MTSTTARPGRPLPSSVYWRRRLFVLGVLVALVLIGVNVLRDDPAPGAGVRATTVGADSSGDDQGEDAGSSTSGPGSDGKRGRRKRDRAGAAPGAPDLAPGPTVVLPTAPPLAEPEGACADEDVTVTPTVRDAVAGRSATIVLALRTITSAACTWDVSAESLAVRISVGDEEVWASRQCPGQVPARAVVVRQAVATSYELTWNTRRSDTDCPELTTFAVPGDYRVTAAAYGGEPADVVFDLPAPTTQVPEPEPKPKPEPKKKRGERAPSEVEQRAPASVDETP